MPANNKHVPQFLTSPATPSPDMVRAARVFTVLSMAYHTKWNNAVFSTEREAHAAMALWGEHLRPFTDAQIEKTCKAIISRYPSWPPTLGEFVALAREYEDFTPEYYQAKPHTPASPEVKRAVADMMSKLKADLEAGKP